MSVKIVAELSSNHNGKIENMIKLIDAAKDAGADAVKLQTYTADSITVDGDRDDLVIKDGPWKGRKLHDLYDEASTPWAWHQDLFHYAEHKGLQIFSTPFDKVAVDFLESIRAPFPIFKVSSFDVINIPLLKRLNQSYRPVYLSTGMATISEISRALDVLSECDVTLLHCISDYPARPEDMNLNRIDDLRGLFMRDVGLSDHSEGFLAAEIAVAKGATVIEKHLKLFGASGPDAAFSADPADFNDMVESIREAERACSLLNTPMPHIDLRPSLWVVKNVKAGEIADWQNVCVRRPASGLAPGLIYNLIGGRFTRDITAPEPVAEGMIA